MRTPIIPSLAAWTTLVLLPQALLAQVEGPDNRGTAPASGTFEAAAADIQKKLADSIAELGRLQEQIRAEKVPLIAELDKLDAELAEVRRVYQEKVLSVDRGSLDLSSLQADNKQRKDQATYLANLLGQYIREFETRLLVAERPRYIDQIDAAKLAVENSNLTQRQVFELQAGVVSRSIDRLDEALGGTMFPGKAVDAEGRIKEGKFVVVGPAAVFLSDDDRVVGTAEQRLDSVTPAAVPFAHPRDAEAAAALVAKGNGSFPLDPTLGRAQKIHATEEPLLQHIQKGGPVMVPIFVMAGLALLVAIWKWVSMAFLRRPSKRQVAALFDAISQRDRGLALIKARAMKGPTGAMLTAGVEHLDEPKELIEEVMYEKVMTTRLQVQRLLPFIAICASSAPLLGLLGTVTGIIETFKLITAFGSGDVKTLSGGISEALITTEYGLIVAIPSLLLHAYLSRKANGVVGGMERSAVMFQNHLSKTRSAESSTTAPHDPRRSPGMHDLDASATPDAELVRKQVSQIIEEMLAPLRGNSTEARSRPARASSA